MAKAKVDRSEAEIADKVIRKVAGVKEDPKTKTAQLPVVSDAFETPSEISEAIDLVESGHALKEIIDRAEKGWQENDIHIPGLEEVKEKVIAMAMAAGIPGYRYGTMAVEVVQMPGRKTLNKDLLREKMLDAGIDPVEVSKMIEESHTEGDAYYRAAFRNLT